jgi:hypothetical protein
MTRAEVAAPKNPHTSQRRGFIGFALFKPSEAKVSVLSKLPHALARGQRPFKQWALAQTIVRLKPKNPTIHSVLINEKKRD